MEWILVVKMIYQLNGCSLNSIDGFDSREACEKAGEQIKNDLRTRHSVMISYTCVERDKHE